MMTHEQASELLAVYALDAVESEEHEAIESHLAGCPRCRAELDAHREVAAALGNSVEPLPEGLWSSIASRLPPRPDEEPPPMPSLVREGPGGEVPPAAGFRPPSPQPPRRSRGRLISVASFAVAAAAVAAVLGVNLVHDNNRISNLQNGVTASASAALHAPGHKVVDVVSATHVELARFVVLRSGQGYLVKSNLPPLSATKTYQLWGVIKGRAISLGLLGTAPHGVAFTLAGSPQPSKLGITVEPAGGSVVPTGSMLAAGTV